MKARNIFIVIIFAGVFFSCKPKEPRYIIETTMGNIKVKLYKETPLHKDNFEKLVSEQFYDNVQFHRVIRNFMIQAGNVKTKQLAPGERPPMEEEVENTISAEFVPQLYHKRGALAAARKDDYVNPEKRSSGLQFYIVQGRTYSDNELNELEYHIQKKFTIIQRNTYKKQGGTPFLDDNYTVFGEVIEGMDVVDKIAASPTDSGDWPVNEIRILRIIKD